MSWSKRTHPAEDNTGRPLQRRSRRRRRRTRCKRPPLLAFLGRVDHVSGDCCRLERDEIYCAALELAETPVGRRASQRWGSWIPEKERAEKVWRVRSRLMGGRSGRVNSVRSRMCGQGGVAGAAAVTSLQGCGGGRRSPQGLETGLRAPQRRVESKKGGTKAWSQASGLGKEGR